MNIMGHRRALGDISEHIRSPIEVMERPPSSLDLSPIEKLWFPLKDLMLT